MADIESEFVERKESLSANMGKAIREVVCAFANDLGDHRRAGVLFVGARDDGSPAGLEVSDRLLNDLAAVKDDGNYPSSSNRSRSENWRSKVSLWQLSWFILPLRHQ